MKLVLTIVIFDENNNADYNNDNGVHDNGVHDNGN